MSPRGERDKDHWLVTLLLLLSFINPNGYWFNLVVVVVPYFPPTVKVPVSYPSTRTGTYSLGRVLSTSIYALISSRYR